MVLSKWLCIWYNEIFYFFSGGDLPPGCWEQVMDALKEVEEEMGAKLGDGSNPLLLSVRSGAAVSYSTILVS